MKVIILSVGKPRNRHSASMGRDYLQRIGAFYKVGLLFAPECKDPQEARKVEREGREILKMVRERDFLVALDERGDERDSLSFAKWFSEKLHQTDGRMVFALGGAFGLSDEVKERADCLLSLSKMTMPHELCHVFILEQIYRACTIIKGVNYHH